MDAVSIRLIFAEERSSCSATSSWVRPLPVRSFRTGQVVGVAFSPDGRLLATASWDAARLWG